MKINDKETKIENTQFYVKNLRKKKILTREKIHYINTFLVNMRTILLPEQISIFFFLNFHYFSLSRIGGLRVGPKQNSGCKL